MERPPLSVIGIAGIELLALVGALASSSRSTVSSVPPERRSAPLAAPLGARGICCPSNPEDEVESCIEARDSSDAPELLMALKLENKIRLITCDCVEAHNLAVPIESQLAVQEPRAKCELQMFSEP